MQKIKTILDAAEKVVSILAGIGVESVVIGGVALAAHNYIRSTDDLDLGINVDFELMNNIADILRQNGFVVELSSPDIQDPLNGVINILGEFGLIQIVNFGDRFPSAIEDAIKNSILFLREGSSVKIAPIPQLVALKLYAGGYKSKADIVELIARNPNIDKNELLRVCKSYRLKGLKQLIV